MSEFHKSGVSLDEYHMHQYVYDLNIVNVPKIISYDKDTQILVMQRLNSDPDTEINESLQEKDRFDDIRDIIRALYDNNIEYPDITVYNFIEDNKNNNLYNDKIWIIDFEHSKIVKKIENKFVNKFINGLNKWNPDFIYLYNLLVLYSLISIIFYSL